MVEQFGVSHTVVREATKALDFLGIIDAAPRRGMVLDAFNFDRVSDYFGFHFALCDYPKDILLQSRMVIEIGVLPYTMEAMKKDPALYPRLRTLAASAPDVDQADDEWINYEIAFHRGLVVASGLAPLASLCDLFQAFFHRFRAEVGTLQAGKEQHLQIVEALHNGKLDAAERILRSQLTWYETHIEAATSPNARGPQKSVTRTKKNTHQ